jgi:type IV pilus biogenesis protein CpaD/CtpE
MRPQDKAHYYKFAQALQEAIAIDIENKKDLFTNLQDAETAKRIIRRQV